MTSMAIIASRRLTVARPAADSTYVYDGDGRRVKKIVAGLRTLTTIFVDIAGHLVAEYSDQPEIGGSTSYLTVDHLGTHA